MSIRTYPSHVSDNIDAESLMLVLTPTLDILQTFTTFEEETLY